MVDKTAKNNNNNNNRTFGGFIFKSVENIDS